jgi:nicotinamide phosphoribosyltransferase
MLDQFTGEGRGPFVAVVSDSYDIWRAVDQYWGKDLKSQIVALGDTKQCLVVRPDSGDPAIVAPEVVARLGAAFGYRQNRMGYKVLPDYVRVIQGDGVNEISINEILTRMDQQGWAAENMTFGMGGEMLQTMNRDTQMWAMKANAIKLAGDQDWRKVMKNPVTSSKKVSKAGRLALTHSCGIGGGTYRTLPEEELNNSKNYLEDVFVNGEIFRTQTLGEIRDLSNQGQ